MIRIIHQRLTTHFSAWELRYHLLLIPILIPLCNYYLIGPDYFSGPDLFVGGTFLLLVLYSVATIGISKAVRWTIGHYPNVGQSTQRTLALLVVLSVLSSGAVVVDVWMYSLIPAFGTVFTWVRIRPILILTLLFDFAFCTALSLFYAYQQWHKDQTTNEQLRQATYQNQLDALKMRINPHFLFNSLTSLSSLIGENKQQAAQFVDELSKVYRYLLQANTRELVSLQTELTFMASYSNLLQTRYGSSLSITYAIEDAYLDRSLPHLSLQTLIDNAIKHNAMSPVNPLLIRIITIRDAIMVQNNLQRKIIKVETSPANLTMLIAKYRQLSKVDVRVEETETYFSVVLPLLTNQAVLESERQ